MIRDILDFWFEEAGPDKWYVKNPDFDREITDRFLGQYAQAAAGKLDAWMDTPEGALALVLLLDQFPRNMFRDTAKAFATDEKALTIAKASVARGDDAKIPVFRSRFFYLPYMHSEDLQDQEACVRLFEAVSDRVDNLKWALAHRDVIEKFGRFPHRNAALGRTTTPEEQAWLDAGGGF